MASLLERLRGRTRYERNTRENWDLRPDVAGYEYADEGVNWRIGVLRNVVESAEDFDAIKAILETPFTPQVTRNMARAVLTRKTIEHLPPALEKLLPDVEAVISLGGSGNPKLEDCYQVIFARNDASRQTPKDVMEREQAAAQRAFKEGKDMRSSGGLHPLPPDTHLERITTNSDREFLASCYDLANADFTTSPEEFDELLDDGSTIMMAAIKEESGQKTVVGFLYAWKDTDVLYRKRKKVELNMYEMMGGEVKGDTPGHDVSRALSERVLHELAQRKDAEAVFTHSNAESPAAFSVAAQTGSTLATTVARELGIPIRPLQKATKTDGVWVDEIASYMGRKKLIELYGTAA